ncbi:MAG: hypothetical protein EDR02_18645 [Actinobacteria bacterium]|nr:MAG: hypothetical protein EDR02_18645 [Actinomycetota bacterium]RIK02288.1 MAG: hypothetical protein DCC48_18355 [Acidobacteriota bacterium]
MSRRFLFPAISALAVLLLGACSDDWVEANREGQEIGSVLLGLRQDHGVEMIVPGCEYLSFEGLYVATRTDDGRIGEEIWAISADTETGPSPVASIVLGQTPEGFIETTPFTGDVPIGVELEIWAEYEGRREGRSVAFPSWAIFRVEELPEGDSVLVFQVEPLAEVSEEEFGRLAVEGDCVEWPEPAQSEESPVLSSSTTAPETSSTTTSTVPAPLSSSSSTASTSTSSSSVGSEGGAEAIQDE